MALGNNKTKNQEMNCLQALAGCTKANNAIITHDLPMPTKDAGRLRDAVRSDRLLHDVFFGLSKQYADPVLADLATQQKPATHGTENSLGANNSPASPQAQASQSAAAAPASAAHASPAQSPAPAQQSMAHNVADRAQQLGADFNGPKGPG